MREIVVNRCFGGFGLSEEAYEYMGLPWDGYGFTRDLPRDDPKLVACVKELGEAANGIFAELDIVAIPDDVDWEIQEYDGREWVAEKHRTW